MLVDNWVCNIGCGTAVFSPCELDKQEGWCAGRENKEAKTRRPESPVPGSESSWKTLGFMIYLWILKLYFHFLLKLTWVCFYYFQPERPNQCNFLECRKHVPEQNLKPAPSRVELVT